MLLGLAGQGYTFGQIDKSRRMGLWTKAHMPGLIFLWNKDRTTCSPPFFFKKINADGMLFPNPHSDHLGITGKSGWGVLGFKILFLTYFDIKYCRNLN